MNVKDHTTLFMFGGTWPYSHRNVPASEDTYSGYFQAATEIHITANGLDKYGKGGKP